MSEDVIRAYRAADRDACLALFDGNTPGFFAPSERADFVRFLERHAAEWAFQVIHRQGLGRLLTQARLHTAAEMPGVAQVHLDTSQHSEGFYARLGFQTERVTVDGYGPGLDRYDMVRTVQSAMISG
ncbi:GNAT family N-acetyltransferase [Sphingomonas sp. 2378]